MKAFETDMHMHTLVSGHAYGTIREMAAAAAEKELKLIGITEHAPGVPGTVDPFYYVNLNVIPRHISGVQVIHGCEINVLNDGTLSLDEQYIAKLDYAIAGIHCGLCYEDAGREQNTQNVISCMKHPKVKLISHPDDDHTPLDYEKLVLAAKEYGVALEVNNSSLLKPHLRVNCFENYRTMLALCAKYRVPILVDSDAHDPSWVGEHTKARAMLEEYGFDESLILSTDAEKVKAFLGAKL